MIARLQALGGAGLDLDTYSRSACELLRRAVDHEYACLATTDPATGLITWTAKTEQSDTRDVEFAHFEYEVDDVNQFTSIAQRTMPVGVLEHDTNGHPERSARHRDFLLPHFGFGHEVRVAFRDAGRVWGVVGLYRAAGPSGFTRDDAGLLARLSAVVGAGLRTSLVIERTATLASPDGPAALVIGPDDEIRQSTPAAQARVDELGGRPCGALPTPLLSLVAAARALRAGQRASPPQSRIRLPSGEWVVAHAAPLSQAGDGPGDVLLALEKARPPDILPVVTAAIGLTNRETDVVSMVLQGADTAAISRRLHLSPHTVQDHLKSVFAKAQVSSRRQLIARLFFDHYVPAMSGSPNPDGWLERPG